jgi:hypothetical protein
MNYSFKFEYNQLSGRKIKDTKNRENPIVQLKRLP